jgi:hypothetical protein
VNRRRGLLLFVTCGALLAAWWLTGPWYQDDAAPGSIVAARESGANEDLEEAQDAAAAPGLVGSCLRTSSRVRPSYEQVLRSAGWLTLPDWSGKPYAPPGSLGEMPHSPCATGSGAGSRGSWVAIPFGLPYRIPPG